ncbi:MAG: hypothetical protein AVDCRST_MAG16-518, partial [uncultured Frankineae bacterium]
WCGSWTQRAAPSSSPSAACCSTSRICPCRRRSSRYEGRSPCSRLSAQRWPA